MSLLLDRRSFLRYSSVLGAAAQAGPFGGLAFGADSDAIAETAYGKVRGALAGDVRIFKGIPYGGDTGGKNRFMPPVKPVSWTGVRDALAYGPTAPQTVAGSGRGGGGRPAESEDCLV